MKRVAAAALVAFMQGCTTFTVTTDDNGAQVFSSTPPLIGRTGQWEVRHQWLDANNELHEVAIFANTEERPDAQLRLLEAAFDMGLKAGTP